MSLAEPEPSLLARQLSWDVESDIQDSVLSQGSDDSHGSSESINEQIESFKNDFIFPEMIAGEKEYSMFEWLKVLPQHSFTQRHFENSESVGSPLRKAAHQINELRKNSEDNEIKE